MPELLAGATFIAGAGVFVWSMLNDRRHALENAVRLRGTEHDGREPRESIP